METVFLVCFAFGALFTAVSAVLGLAHTSVPGADVGHFGHLGHGVHAPHGARVPHVANAGHMRLPVPLLAILNASSVLAFLTWFGAAGYLALRFGGWTLAPALAVAVAAGLAGALLLGAFLNKVTAGEQVLDPRAFRLEGTLARVTVSVPAQGAGEVVFIKEGRTRSEAARSATGNPIPRGTEVVILRYDRGVAHVQPWDQLLEERPPPRLPGAVESKS
jgi:membrane protein implicated in regulation of membrane protease activity